MNKNAEAILILCSFVGASKQKVQPFQPKEWSELALKLKNKNYQPYQLLELKDDKIKDLELDQSIVERIKQLVDRSSAITFDMNKLERLGIKYVTRANKEYPKILKERLGNSCPPLLYYCGDLKLLADNYIGFVGSREVKKEDIDIDHILIDKCLQKGFGIISGGAKGIDSESTTYCLSKNGCVVEILADSMEKKLKKKEYIEAIRNKKLLCISIAAPEAGFDVGMAMMRNKFIYLFSKGTIVIKTSYNTVGTWAGAVECIKKGYSPINVVDNGSEGSKSLIAMKAKAIDKDWDGSFDDIIPIPENKKKNKEKPEKNEISQLSLF